MSDPFEVLRSSSPHDVSPDVGAIRGRARRIERRRQLLASGSAVSIAAVALIAVLVGLGPADRPGELASRDAATDTTADLTTPQSGAEGEASKAETTGTEADAVRGLEQGARSDSTGEAVPGQTSAGSAVGAAPASADALVAKIDEVTPRTLGGADFLLEVCNTSSQTVERTFSDAQRYDFEVRKDGEVVWTWSDGRMFAQSTGAETWKAGGCKRWSAGWDGRNDQGIRAADGAYEVVGVLVGKPEVRSKAVSFCHGIC